jgi:GlpG protein
LAAFRFQSTAMREIGEFSNEQDARRLGDYLYAKGIGNDVDEDDGEWTLWIHDDDQLAEATAELKSFRANPSASEFAKGARQAATLRKKEAEQNERAAKRQVDVRTQVFGQSPIGTPCLTFLLIGLCVMVQVLSVAEKDVSKLKISNFPAKQHITVTRVSTGEKTGEINDTFLAEITGKKVLVGSKYEKAGTGQVWRLVTPILLHFDWMHFIFNLYWLYFLGGGMEGKLGTGRFLGFILLAAVLSNLGQYLLSGPNFGGMSGVNYGLFGYLWIRGNRDPSFGLQLDQGTITMLLIWFAICFTGLVGPIANTAHTLGLVVGVAGGWLASQRAMR